MEPVLTLRNVSFRYSEESEWALKDVNFELFPGEWVTILGGNGSGKSTMAKLINGLLLPTEGMVTVFNKNTENEDHLWEIRQKVGMVFQNPENQIVAMTVSDDVAFGLENIGIAPDEIERRIDRVLEQLGLSPFKNQEPYSLSGGQKQRLAIAGVVAMEPEVIIFDEATSMLDPQGAKDVYHTMLELNQRGIGIIHITHEMEEIYDSDRILVLSKGDIKLVGTPREILSQPELLREAGLVPPFAVRIREALLGEGITVAPSMITEQELVDEIWKLFSIK